MKRSIWILSLVFVLGCGGSDGYGVGGGVVDPLPDISSQFGGGGGGGDQDTTTTDAAQLPDTQGTGVDDVVAVDSVMTNDMSCASDSQTMADTTGPAPCGDGQCEASESCQSCPADCGFCPKSCGDGKCDSDENCKNCSADCGNCPAGCGDGKCDATTENCQSCSVDCGQCPPMCGDKECNGQETCSSCPLDCGACPGTCGDGTCDKTKENCQNCSADCGQCPGICEPLSSKGCPATQQCYPTQTSAACGNPGSITAGNPCTVSTSCAKGMLCVGSICKPLCDSSGADANFNCSEGTCDALQYSDGKPVGFNLGTCVVFGKCNATTNVGCAVNQNCDVSDKGTFCISHGTKTNGMACTSLNECAKGFMCIGNPMVCMKKCATTGGTPSCPGGTSCSMVTIDNNNTPAPNNLGVCN
ncbi:MAG TPA: hypothetical protein DCQ06_11455 [Myxococcales bacterium]|nr:hypothetical protein [Myxococcales bacterium]HAN32205.1 hypothetical protein [Myxococcales bacterium]